MITVGKVPGPLPGFFLAVVPPEGSPFLGDSSPGVEADAAKSGMSPPSDGAGPMPTGTAGAFAFFFFEVAAEGVFLTTWPSGPIFVCAAPGASSGSTTGVSVSGGTGIG